MLRARKPQPRPANIKKLKKSPYHWVSVLNRNGGGVFSARAAARAHF